LGFFSVVGLVVMAVANRAPTTVLQSVIGRGAQNENEMAKALSNVLDRKSSLPRKFRLRTQSKTRRHALAVSRALKAARTTSSR